MSTFTDGAIWLSGAKPPAFLKWLEENEELRTGLWCIRSNPLALWISSNVGSGFTSTTTWYGATWPYDACLPKWMEKLLTVYDHWGIALYSDPHDSRTPPVATCNEILSWMTNKKPHPEWKCKPDMAKIREKRRLINLRNRR